MSITRRAINAQDFLLKETFTTIPNRFIDEIAPTLSAAELRAMLYIYRHTLGFHKLADCISYEQFTDGITTQDGRRLDSGAGICRQSLVKALAALQARGLITRHNNAYKATTTRLAPLAAITQQAPVKQIQEVDRPVAAILDQQNKEPKQINKEPGETPAEVIQLVEIIPGLTEQEARQAIAISEQNARTFQYCLALARYVTTNPAIHTPAAAFRALVQQNATRQPTKAIAAPTGHKQQSNPFDTSPGGKYGPGGKYAYLLRPPQLA